MDNIISSNVEKIEISGIRKFYNKVLQYKDAISLTLGQPDFKVPEKVKVAMIEALEQGKTEYTANAGIIELREEISRYLAAMGICYKPEEICVTVGGSEGLMSVFTALINPLDKVLIPTPAYPAYESCVKLSGGLVVNYNLDNNFGLDFENLEKLINEEKPKLMVLSFPSNPTGAVLKKEDRDKLFKILIKNDIIVISDEIYSSLCFETDYYSIAQFTELLDRVILVSGFSKMLSMTGLRVGYVCAMERYMKEIIKVHQYYVSSAPSISQWGALEGLKSCSEDILKMKLEFMNRRDYVVSRLNNMGIKTTNPKGAFYIFISIDKFNLSSEEFCDRLLEEAKVAIVPGSAFGIGGEGFARISYSYSREELKEALDRIEKWINKNPSF